MNRGFNTHGVPLPVISSGEQDKNKDQVRLVTFR